MYFFFFTREIYEEEKIERSLFQRRSELKIDIFNPADCTRFNFHPENDKGPLYLHVLTLSVSIRGTILHRSPRLTEFNQILNRKSIIAQSDLNLCNSTVIGEHRLISTGYRAGASFCTTFSLYLRAATRRGIYQSP